MRPGSTAFANRPTENAEKTSRLLGYGGAYKALHDADLVLLLGTDFPFS